MRGICRRVSGLPGAKRGLWSRRRLRAIHATRAAEPRVTRATARCLPWRRHRLPTIALATATVGGVASWLWSREQALAEQSAAVEVSITEEQVGAWVDGLPAYSRADVSQRDGKDGSPAWVSYKSGVYDVTDFAKAHPGGEKVFLAAGSALEPFWALYAQHKAEHVWTLLETLRIGNLQPADDEDALVDSEDPYSHDPARLPVLVVRSHKPFNAETPPALLTDHWLTPNALFYVRNHLPVPVIDPDDYVLHVALEGLPEREWQFTLKDLEAIGPRKSVAAVIQCAGNRRDEMSAVRTVKGGRWDIGAIGNAEWAGVPLRHVLLHVLQEAGVSEEEANQRWVHVHFEGLDNDPSTGTKYGSSILLSKALDPSGDCVLATSMNGETLPSDHGYPVRAVVPGVVGARNVKWLGYMMLSRDESPSHWQQKDYKGFGPNIDWHNVVWEDAGAISIQELPVVSAISSPDVGQRIEGDAELTVKGYAWSGGGRGIARIDVSADNGNTWMQADVIGSPSQDGNQVRNRMWSWTTWEAQLPVPEHVRKNGGEMTIVCKAVDSAYNTQPETVAPIWNLRGVLNNSWHRVTVTLEPEE